MPSVGVRYFVTVHAGHIEAARIAGRIQQGVITDSFGTKTEVVADQYIFGPQSAHQHVIDEGLGRQSRQSGAKRQHHALIDAAVGQVGQFVAQGAYARGCQSRVAGDGGKVIARVGLEGQRATGHTALLRLTLE